MAPQKAQKWRSRNLPSLPGVKPSGKVGKDLTLEEGYATARAIAEHEGRSAYIFSTSLEKEFFNRIGRCGRLRLGR